MNVDLSLNNRQINTDGYPLNQEDYSIRISDCDLEVVFRNQKERLLELIRVYPYVCGCIAWLTDTEVLSAMADMKHVSIIVQKEDFLRPDLSSSSNFPKKLRAAYNALPIEFERYFVESGIVSRLSVAGDPTMDPVRCVGNHNSNKLPAFPRMHNKFLVFTEGFSHKDELGNELDRTLGISDNACVWTGSYNISNTATKSLENAIIIRNKQGAQAYFNEWAQITALSEPLDWESEWCEPEWRIGT